MKFSPLFYIVIAVDLALIMFPIPFIGGFISLVFAVFLTYRECFFFSLFDLTLSYLKTYNGVLFMLDITNPLITVVALALSYACVPLSVFSMKFFSSFVDRKFKLRERVGKMRW